MLGLKRSAVRLFPHDPAWEEPALDAIMRLRGVLGHAAQDIQHIGSTSIPHIAAKPIIDIAVIHVVRHGGKEWRNYVNFRDYLTRRPEEAQLYETVKLELAARFPGDRAAYTEGKREIISYLLRKATAWSWLGKKAHIVIDRPVGHIRRKSGYSLVYPINYGYIPGVLGGDGEYLDVYLLGVSEPVRELDCRVIGMVHRRNDVEDKLIAAPDGMRFTKAEMESAVRFQEQYYDSLVQTADEA